MKFCDDFNCLYDWMFCTKVLWSISVEKTVTQSTSVDYIKIVLHVLRFRVALIIVSVRRTKYKVCFHKRKKNDLTPIIPFSRLKLDQPYCEILSNARTVYPRAWWRRRRGRLEISTSRRPTFRRRMCRDAKRQCVYVYTGRDEGTDDV